MSVLPIPALHHAVCVPIASWEPRTWRAVFRCGLGACPRLGGKHEAAVVVMINMTVFEVMVGRWAVNLEQEEEDMGGLPRGTQTEGLSESGCGFEG